MRTGSRQLDAAINTYMFEGFDKLGAFIMMVLERQNRLPNPHLYEVMCKKVMRMVGEIENERRAEVGSAGNE